MNIRNATPEDIDAILRLHRRYQVDTIADEDRSDGFVTTDFTPELLRKLIESDEGFFVAAREDSEIAGYVMAASWEFCSRWPIFTRMIEDLPTLSYRGIPLSTENSYQYGPVCIDKPYRGSGLLEEIFEFAREAMKPRYPVLVTFVNKANPRSYAAHSRKLGLDTITEFAFNGNEYYEMACLTETVVIPHASEMNKEE